MDRRTLTGIIALALLIVGQGRCAWGADPIKVVASFSILGDMVRQIGGDDVSVTVLVGADGDAHGYQPRPQDARAVAAAQVVVANGLGLDPWMGRLRASAAPKVTLVTASDAIQSLPLPGTQMADPHAWQDLSRAQAYVSTIAQALEAASPDHAAAIAARAANYAAKLADLDHWAHQQLDAIPPQNRHAITTHMSFHYFGQAYGIEFLAPQGPSTEAEPAPKDVAHLIERMHHDHVRAVFLENMTDPRLPRQIAKDGGGIVGGTLYADALSGPNGPAPTFEAMFRWNVAVIRAALVE